MAGEGVLRAERGIAFVWQVKLSDIACEQRLRRYESILSPQECERRQRFAFARDRHRFLVTRALVRTALSRFAPVAPQDWRFADNGYGRPMIDPCHTEARNLTFSVSHSGDWVVVAIGHGVKLGVDTEHPGRDAPLDIAPRYFAGTEAEDLRGLPADEQPFRFFELWTLKESYVKARGLGLSIPLKSFAFDLRKPGTVIFACPPDDRASAAKWRFLLCRAGDDQLVSLCWQTVEGRDLKVTWRKGFPLENDSVFEPVILRRSPDACQNLQPCPAPPCDQNT